MTTALHAARALERPVPTPHGDVPRWLHSDTPYGEILEAAHAGTLGQLLPHEDGDLERYVVRALVGLAVPSDYGTRGEDHVTHIPCSWVAASRDADTLAASNYAVAVEALEAVDPDREHWFEGRTSHWGVGYIDHPSVRPFVREDDGTWSVTAAWREAVEIGEALEAYPVLSEDDLSAREHEELTAYVADLVGDDEDGAWTVAVLEALEAHTVEDVRTDRVEEVIHAVYVDRVAALLETYRAWETLRHIGTGQLTIYGDEVTVPEPPTVEALRDLTDVRLPVGVARAVEDGDDHAAALAALEALETLHGLAVPA